MNEIKVGDTVRVSEKAPKSEIFAYDKIFTLVDCKVASINDGVAYITYCGDSLYLTALVSTKYLVNSEPKEPTIKVGDWAVVKEDAVGIALDKWRQYEADLAKELAVQMVKANRNNYDKIGKIAVDVAKSVVENLKKREE